MSFIKRELSFFERVRFYQRKGEKHIFIAEKHHFMANTFLVFFFFFKQKNMLFSLIVLRNLYFLGLFIKKRLRVRVAYEQEKSEKLGNVLDRLTYTRLAGDLRHFILFCLKGQCHKIFNISFSKNSTWAPNKQAKTVSRNLSFTEKFLHSP